MQFDSLSYQKCPKMSPAKDIFRLLTRADFLSSSMQQAMALMQPQLCDYDQQHLAFQSNLQNMVECLVGMIPAAGKSAFENGCF